jgi:hypothetical protein
MSLHPRTLGSACQGGEERQISPRRTAVTCSRHGVRFVERHQPPGDLDALVVLEKVAGFGEPLPVRGSRGALTPTHCPCRISGKLERVSGVRIPQPPVVFRSCVAPWGFRSLPGLADALRSLPCNTGRRSRVVQARVCKTLDTGSIPVAASTGTRADGHGPMDEGLSRKRSAGERTDLLRHRATRSACGPGCRRRRSRTSRP